MTNDVVHIVTWDGGSDDAAYAGQPLSLRFELRAAKLYAFEFVKTGAHE
ncbi:MAG TPA: hypothetical protein PLM14_06540 [Candidatus Hydrogenedentes bacterium]|nr:hypothetical protein [Candidatus Hydrogenedentota bacterium]HQE82641.1 hypothetical protein [Candidatus Hydrogenedentota bacterium]HQH51887.1 hypothetical protein [Candidatus Hydrogenedentota bacterium]HQM49381.1 hypothetical protein [Candidatus Hydrogenedentota bacterium]